MKSTVKILTVFIALLVVSCSSEPSLQKYYVKHQNADNFIVIDLPIGMVFQNLDKLPEKSRKAMKTIRKANVLALPLTGDNAKQYKKERKKVTTILQNGDYKLLMQMSFSGKNIQLRYLGEEKAIDEVVVMAYDDSKGFIVARLLGDEMNPEAFLRILETLKNDKLDLKLEGMDELDDFFEDNGKDKN